MMIHQTVLAGLALGLFAAPAPRGAAVATRYRIESKTETTIDLSVFGQPAQQVTLGLVSWIAVSLSDTAGGRVLRVVVDSIQYDGAIPQITKATADSARGGTLHGFIDPNGHVQNIVSRPEENAFLADVQGVIHGFFPKTRTGAKAGDVWTDTVEVTNTANGSNLKSRYAIDYRAVGQETVAGVAALKLSANSKGTVSGTTQNPMAGTVEVEGTVTGSSQSLIAADGRYLGGSSTATSDQLVKTAMSPSPIPIKTVRTVTVALLP